MDIRSIVENTRDLIGDEELRKDSRTFCKECGKITESREDRCIVCNSIVGRVETLVERVIGRKEMSEFGREYPRHPQIIEFLSDHWHEFLDREDCLNQIGKTFDVSRADAEQVVDAVKSEMGRIGKSEVYANRKDEDDEKPIKSILQDIAKEVNEEPDLEKAKQIVINRATASGIKDIDKKKIETAVDKVTNKNDLITYVWNSIMKYIGLGVIKPNEQKEIKEQDYEVISSGMTKEDAEKLSREKKDSVVVQNPDDPEKYSVIKKEEKM